MLKTDDTIVWGACQAANQWPAVTYGYLAIYILVI